MTFSYTTQYFDYENYRKRKEKDEAKKKIERRKQEEVEGKIKKEKQTQYLNSLTLEIKEKILSCFVLKNYLKSKQKKPKVVFKFHYLDERSWSPSGVDAYKPYKYWLAPEDDEKEKEAHLFLCTQKSMHISALKRMLDSLLKKEKELFNKILELEKIKIQNKIQEKLKTLDF